MYKQSTALLFTLLFFTLSLWSQKRSYHPEPARHSTFSMLSQNGLEERSVTDTLLPEAFFDNCSVDQVIFTITDSWGTVGGMNGLGDFEKAQLIFNVTNTSISITNAVVFFDVPGIVNDGNLRAKVYTANAADGSPQSFLGQSDDIKASQINADATSVLATVFPFSNPVNLNDPAFFLSIELADLYATRDTVGLLHTDNNCGNGDEAYELWNDNTWHSMQDSWSTQGTEDFNINFSIFAVVEFEDPSDVNDPFVQKGNLRIFPAAPNPATNSVRLGFELEEAGPVQIEVYSTDGKRVQRLDLGRKAGGQHVEEIDVTNFSAGPYIYSIATEKGRLLSRFVVN